MFFNEFEKYLRTEHDSDDELYRKVFCEPLYLDIKSKKEKKQSYIQLQPTTKRKESAKDDSIAWEHIPLTYPQRKGITLFISLMTRCNMNCPNCPSYSRLSIEHSDWQADMGELECDLMRMKEFANIKALHIVGGDPLLLEFEDLREYFGIIRSVFDDDTAIIVHTTAVQLHRDAEEYYKLFKEYNIQFIAMLDKNNYAESDKIFLKIYYDTFINYRDPSKNMEGIPYAITYKNGNGCGFKEPAKDNKCRRIYLVASNLYLCSKQAHAATLEYANINNPEQYITSLNIYDDRLSDKKTCKKTLIDFYSQAPNELCKYCKNLKILKYKQPKLYK